MKSNFRRFVDVFRATPFHPQWLLPGEEFERSLLREKAFGDVLDIGCADCWAKKHVAADCVYVGLDFPSTAIHMYNTRPNVFADAATLPFADESFDTVVLFQTLEHLASPLNAVDEIYRVLRPNGLLLLTVPFLYPLHDEPHDYTRFTNHGLIRVLGQAGFSLQEITPSLDSARTAGLIASLTFGGMVIRSFELRSISILLAPVFLISIPLVNVGFWLASKLMPTWTAVSAGFKVLAKKPV